MFTVDEVKNVVIVRARELYGQVPFAKMAKGNMEQLTGLVEDLWDHLNIEIDLMVADLQNHLIPLEEDEQKVEENLDKDQE